ncbi:MAG: tripartite tricarboxylate transporter substrate binding protein [Burkholderiaceae bacterium]|nr:tripartite tricarboxylate transporter substrate binding protein [Burkholderiaceae bacterium]MDO9088622.1 tripartite tricarboxylate transporter substrate binding protein [Burkholderiaceae bacterium]
MIVARTKRALLLGLVSMMASAGWQSAHAQAYPNRTITLVSPFPAGGGGDALMRPLAKRLGEVLGQPVILENKPGAGQTIGSAYVARSAPDGYTLLAHFLPTHVNVQAVYANLPYHPIKSFAPIAQVATGGPQILLVNSASKIRNFQEFIAATKAKPNFGYGSQGAGSMQHLLGELLRTDAQMPWIHVPFKGGAPAVDALLGGHIDSIMTDANAIPHVNSGKARAIAVSSAKRLPQIPDVPTFAELGYPGATVDIGLCVFAPAGTPPPIIAKLAATLQDIAREPAIREQFAKISFEAVSKTTQELQDRLESDAKRYWPLIERLGLGKQN